MTMNNQGQNAPFPRMHVSLYVSDIQRTVEFYNTLFGMPPAKVRPGYAKYLLASPALIISFVENPAKVNSHFGHLGIQLETEVELKEKQAYFEEKGFTLRVESDTRCCYALQDKFWVTDPDGAMWEYYIFHEDAEWNDPRFESEAEEACCMPAKKKVSLSSLGKSEPVIS